MINQILLVGPKYKETKKLSLSGLCLHIERDLKGLADDNP